eukprot:SAG31_NODE_2159_length_6302_cov_9.311140_8_plen_43_part_00
MLNVSAVYGPDELPESTVPGINYMFSQIKKVTLRVQTAALLW